MNDEELQRYLDGLRTAVPTGVEIAPVPAGSWVPAPAPTPAADPNYVPYGEKWGQIGAWFNHSSDRDAIAARLAATSNPAEDARFARVPVPTATPAPVPTAAAVPDAVNWRNVGDTLRNPRVVAGGIASTGQALPLPARYSGDEWVAQLNAMNDANRAIKMNVAAGLKDPTALDSVGLAKRLDAEAPKVVDNSYWARVAANLPVYVQGKGFDFAGARKHAMDVTAAERGALNDALKMRQLGIDRKIWYATADNTSANNLINSQNLKTMTVADAAQHNPSAIDLASRTALAAAQMAQSDDHLRIKEAGDTARNNARISAAAGAKDDSPLAALARQLKADVDGKIISEDYADKRWAAALAGKPRDPESVAIMEYAQKSLLDRAGAITRGNPQAMQAANSLAADLGAYGLKGYTRPQLDELANGMLRKLEQQFPPR